MEKLKMHSPNLRIENMLKMLSAGMEVVKSLFPTSKASKPAEPDKTYQPKKAGA